MLRSLAIGLAIKFAELSAVVVVATAVSGMSGQEMAIYTQRVVLYYFIFSGYFVVSLAFIMWKLNSGAGHFVPLMIFIAHSMLVGALFFDQGPFFMFEDEPIPHSWFGIMTVNAAAAWAITLLRSRTVEGTARHSGTDKAPLS